MRSLFIILARAYQRVVSPAVHFVGGPGCGCRFHPSCSHYAIESVERHGVLVGSALTARRVLRCGPWSAGGVDPVPSKLFQGAPSIRG